MDYEVIDTHCHITCDRLYGRIDEIIQNALEHQVTRMMIVCINFDEYERALLVQKRYPEVFDLALGFHPSDIYDFNEQDYERLTAIVKQGTLSALGEIGLDYHWKDVTREDQMNAFIRQIQLAKAYDLPILIHMREATKDTLDILQEHGPIAGVFHCFSGSYETAQQALDMGFYLSFGGPLTFKNARGLPQVAQCLPADRLFVETDCPFLTPHPLRGRENEPMYVRYTFDKLCELKNLKPQQLAKQQQINYQKLFHKQLNTD